MKKTREQNKKYKKTREQIKKYQDTKFKKEMDTAIEKLKESGIPWVADAYRELKEKLSKEFTPDKYKAITRRHISHRDTTP